jgi:hypothetical protein
MFIPFLPKLDAQIILEQHYDEEMQRSEIEAELGSSYFMGGMSSWDASAMARLDLNSRDDEYLATGAGMLYAAQVDAAKFMADAITPDMRVADYRDRDSFDFLPWGATFVREFIPGQLVPEPRWIADEDIPF